MHARISRSSLEHLRFSFSFFLAPVFLFAMSQADHRPVSQVILSFIVLHLCVYPASNGFNSYYDRDEGPIGGIANPKAVTPDLLWVAYGLEGLGLAIAACVNLVFFGLVLVYGLVSKAYSHPSLRWKARPWVGWLAVSWFQGAMVYLATMAALRDAGVEIFQDANVWAGAGLSSLLIGGGYPLTQIYQHQEDARRGDLTLSRYLGIRGTFVFALSIWSLTLPGFLFFFGPTHRTDFWIMLIGLIPTTSFLVLWFLRVLRDPEQANFRNTMFLNRLSSSSMIGVFICLLCS
jgi:hypothetical protein